MEARLVRRNVDEQAERAMVAGTPRKATNRGSGSCGSALGAPLARLLGEALQVARRALGDFTHASNLNGNLPGGRL